MVFAVAKNIAARRGKFHRSIGLFESQVGEFFTDALVIKANPFLDFRAKPMRSTATSTARGKQPPILKRTQPPQFEAGHLD
jgi:hypothetical protein